MSRRVPFVDFGPVALPVSGAAAYWDSANAGAAHRREDTIRLQSLLGLSDADGANSPDSSHVANHADGVFQTLSAELSTQPYADIAANRLATALRCLNLASSVAAATADIATRVQLSLHEDLLPQASLIVERNADGLRFELCVSGLQIANELASGLDRITHELGKQLQIPVILRLIHGPNVSLIREVRWQSGGAA